MYPRRVQAGIDKPPVIATPSHAHPIGRSMNNTGSHYRARSLLLLESSNYQVQSLKRVNYPAWSLDVLVSDGRRRKRIRNEREARLELKEEFREKTRPRPRKWRSIGEPWNVDTILSWRLTRSIMCRAGERGKQRWTASCCGSRLIPRLSRYDWGPP